MNKYESILKEHGLKATYQRMSILSVLDHMGHATVDEVYERVRESHPTISLATVYKNIITMVNSMVITEVPISGMKSKYELKKDDHIHLICTECGDVKDAHMDKNITNDVNSVANNSSFEAESSQVNIYGLCKDCKRA